MSVGEANKTSNNGTEDGINNICSAPVSMTTSFSSVDGEPKHWTGLVKFIGTFLLFLLILIAALYNLTFDNSTGASKEVWVGVLSVLIGILVPSPALKKKKFIPNGNLPVASSHF